MLLNDPASFPVQISATSSGSSQAMIGESKTQEDIFLAHQPILDVNQNIVAYELLFRSGDHGSCSVADDMAASATVIINTFNHFGAEKVLGQRRGFINVNASLLMSDMIELLPRDQVVLELLETVTPSAEVIQRCRQLKTMGFKLALDDFVYDPCFDPLCGLVDFIKLDLMAVDPAQLGGIANQMKRWPVQLLAEKVESVEQFRLCRDLGFSHFQGYYFARPTTLRGKKVDPSKLVLLRLLSQILGDSENKEIEQTFKQQPSLSFNLLRLVNSVAMGLRNPVSSLSQALVMLGRSQLQRWIQLLIYTVSDGSSQSSPLLQLAASRGRLIELLARTQQPGNSDYHDRAFMVGLLSLLDILLGMPMPEILDQLSINDEVKEALLDNSGSLGQLLILAERMERGNFDAAEDILAEADISLAELTAAQMNTFHWVDGLSQPN
ncbi:MAG: EAL domain-containing protein [Sulfurimicrobium sp.]|nr:EAL domain-containing protein [Sulfurimicrobium sp.]